MTLMAIFAAVFTLVNVNMEAMATSASTIITVNLVTVGSFALLAGLIALPLRPKEWYVRLTPWAVAVVCMVVAVVIALP